MIDSVTEVAHKIAAKKIGGNSFAPVCSGGEFLHLNHG